MDFYQESKMCISEELKPLLRQEYILFGKTFDTGISDVSDVLQKIWANHKYEIYVEFSNLEGIGWSENLDIFTYTDELIEEIFNEN